jgi:hypothetical protein
MGADDQWPDLNDAVDKRTQQREERHKQIEEQKSTGQKQKKHAGKEIKQAQLTTTSPSPPRSGGVHPAVANPGRGGDLNLLNQPRRATVLDPVLDPKHHVVPKHQPPTIGCYPMLNPLEVV